MANFSANLNALGRTQPGLQNMLNVPVDLTWTFARDGALTALVSAGQWWGGCSLPMLASGSILKSLESNGQTSCFLAPVHAALLLAARERIGEDPALLTIVPDPDILGVILCCHDFSADIVSHHLWLITGESWPDGLGELLRKQPGLPTPGRFIKTKLTSDEVIEPMIAEAQRILSGIISERAAALETIRSGWTTSERHGVLLIAGSRFRLWDNAGDVLTEHLRNLPDLHRFDCDDPASSSPAALAMAASSRATIIAGNVARADAPDLASPATRWITWLTRPAIPSVAAAGTRDALIVADPAWEASAIAAGWPGDRVAVATWPSIELPECKTSPPHLAILADTRHIEIPKSVEDLSSHRLLWDHIEAELHEDPFAVGQIDEYLNVRAAHFGIDPGSLDTRAFVEDLIVPAYQQGLARALLSAGLPLRLHGRGWSELKEFHNSSSGPVSTLQDQINAAAAARALIYVWPTRHAHPMDRLGKPVISPQGQRRQSFVHQARIALGSSTRRTQTPVDALAAMLKFFIEQ